MNRNWLDYTCDTSVLAMTEWSICIPPRVSYFLLYGDPTAVKNINLSFTLEYSLFMLSRHTLCLWGTTH